MQKGTTVLRILLLLTLATSFCGCKSSPSRFYTLSALPAGQGRVQGNPGSGTMVVNIAPVEIPDYLDRPQIATRDGENRLKLAEYDRWAGSLSDNISSVLAEDLSAQLGTDRVFVNAAAPFDQADYSVVLRVLRLDLVPGDQLLLKAQWTLFSGGDKKGTMHLATLTEKLDGKSYDAMVAAMNRALERLSREVARDITPRQVGAPPTPAPQTMEPPR